MRTIKDIYMNLGSFKSTDAEINSDTDAYTLAASEYFGVPYAEVTKAQRAAVKQAVYMYAYGVRPIIR